LNSGSCLITGLSSGNGLIEGNLDDVSVVDTPSLIVGNPVEDVSVDVTPALIGGNPLDVDDWKFCLAPCC
jgi:hypothetical protein